MRSSAMNRRIFAVAIVGMLVCMWAPHISAAAQPCESLASLKLPDATITAATLVQEGPFAPPAPPVPAARAGAPLPVPSFCRVQLTVAPQIRSEVWMPATGWNGKFEGVGGGGYAGVISYAALATALRAGYATASTDTGHQGNTPEFALGHPELVIDSVTRHSRNDGQRKADHRGFLRESASRELFHRMFHRWPAGAFRSAALPRGL